MRVITVREPYASLIAAGAKPVENRVVGTPYRGPLAIHAGLAFCLEAVDDDTVRAALGRTPEPGDYAHTYGRILVVVELVDVHHADGRCCAPWGWWREPYPRRLPARTLQHLVLADPRPLERPIEARGRLGLWTPDPVLGSAVLRAAGPRPAPPDGDP